MNQGSLKVDSEKTATGKLSFYCPFKTYAPHIILYCHQSQHTLHCKPFGNYTSSSRLFSRLLLCYKPQEMH
jgi:hypothetical protein